MKKSNKRKPLISALEPRIMFDGAAITTAVDVLDNNSYADSSSADTTTDATTDGSTTNETLPISSGDIFIITNDIADYETTVANLSENFKVVVLDETSNDLQTQILNATKDLDSELNVHILAANQSQDKILAGSFESVNDLINSFETSESKLYDLATLVEQDLTPSGENQVIILDESISYSQDILDTIPKDWTVIKINSQSDGLTQILEALDGISNLSTVHLFSHGNAGEIIIGNLTLDSQTIETRATDLAKLGEHLSQTGDILLYGCDVADGYIGTDFLNLLANATSADIAASDDATGTYITNADFDLEQNVGTVESTSISIDTNGQVLGSVSTYNIDIGLNASRLYYQASGTPGTGILTDDNTTWVDQYTNNKNVYYDKIRWERRGWWIFSWSVPIVYTVNYNYGAGVRYSADQFTLTADSEYLLTANMNVQKENYLGSTDNNSYAYQNYALYKGSFDKNNPLQNLVTASDGDWWRSGYIFKGDLEAGNYILVTSFDSWVWWPDSKNWMNLNNYAEQMYGTGTLTVQNLNHAPVIDTINNVTLDGAGDKTTTPLTWSNIYDADGDAITMSAFLWNGSSESALPSWLTFNPNSLTFSGNPPANTGTLTVRVKAYDGQEYGYKDFSVTFTNDNDQPVVTNAIVNQTWDGQGNFTYQIPTDTFTDADPGVDTFTYSATLADGTTPLPSWLSISADGLLSGNPPADYSTISIKVTVNDGSGQTATNTQSDIFTLNLKNNNDIATVSNNTISINEDTTYVFSLADFAYVDTDTHAHDDTTSGDGKDLNFVRILELPKNGTLWLDSNSDGVIDSGEIVQVNQEIAVSNITKLKYTPNENWAGHGTDLAPLDALLTDPDSFKWLISDAYNDSSNTATTTLNVRLINDDPILSFSEGKSLNIRPNGGSSLSAVYVDEGLNLIDPDRAFTDDTLFDTIFGVSVAVIDSLTSTYVSGDLLSLTGSTTGFDVSYDSVNGILTVESTIGGARAQDFQTLLRTLQFSSSDTTNNNDRTLAISFRTQDVGSKTSAYFDGVDDYIETLNTSAIPQTGDFTVSVWAKLDNPSSLANNQYTIFGQGNTNGNLFLQINKTSSTNYDLRLGDYWTITNIDDILSDGKWHQYTITRSGSGTSDGSLFIDGKFIGNGDIESTIYVDKGLRIGRLYDQTINSSTDWTGYWLGSISDVRVYDKVLSSVDIQQSLSNTLTGSESGLRAWYKLESDYYNYAGSDTGNAVVFKDAGYGYSIKTGHYYYFNTTAQTWSSADSTATSSTYAGENGYLINMDDASLSASEKEVAKLMGSLNGDNNIWTGLYRSGAWYWGSGPDSDVAFTHDNVTEGLDNNPSYWNNNYGPAGWWGRFGNSWQYAPWITTNNLETQITFTYYSWDSWDGERFRIQLNGYDLFSIYRTYNSGTNAASWGGTTYINGMPITYSVSRSSSWNMGASGWDDQYFNITVNIPQNFASSVRMSFGAYTDQSIDDESAEIINYQVKTVNPEYQKDRAYMNSVTGYIDNTYSSDPRYSLIEYGNRGEILSAPSLFATTNSALPDKYVNEVRTITVRETNNAPIQSDSWNTSINEDTSFNFAVSDFTSQFSDTDGDTLTNITITTIPNGSDGEILLNGIALSVNDVVSTGDLDKLVFKPSGNFFGDITFAYKGSDGYLFTNEATVTITVNAVNDAPVISTNQTLNTIVEDILDGSNTGQTIADIIADSSITDADGVAVEAIAITSVNNTNGVWQYKVNATSSWTAVSSASGAIINLGSYALLLDNESLLRFVPNTDYNGTSTFSFRAWDKSGSEVVGNTTNPYEVGGNSIVSAEVKTVSLTISSVNDAPTTQDKTITMDEDTSYTFTLADFKFIDTKDSGDEIVSVILTTLPAKGILSLNGTTINSIQSIIKADIENGKLTFTPLADAFGTSYDSFDFKVNDGVDSSVAASSITINVRDTNDAPTGISWASGGSVAENAVSTESSASLVGQLSATDPNTGDTLRFEQLSNNKFVVKPDGTVQLAISSKDQNNVDIALLDYELNATETIRVKVIDSEGLSYELDMTVNVTDIVENTPSLYTNTFYVQKNEIVTITEANLNTVDSDTLDSDLIYTVKQYPSGGTFFIDNDGDNVYDEGVDYLLAPADDSLPENVENFTHSDVVAGKLKFIKDSTQTAGKLSLSVTDGTTTKEATLVGITSTPPELTAAIDDQEWKTTGAQNFVVPASTFYDADQDILTYSATLGDGSDLPLWLSFDSDTRTFSGTPTSYTDGQSISIKVTVTDGRTTPVSDIFDITFKDIILKPVIDNPLPNYIEFDGSGNKSYQIPADTFSDPTSNGITYSATLGDGSDLPLWLNFDSDTRTFSGNPPGDTVYGPQILKITADNGTTTSTTIKLYVLNPNDIPIVNTLSNQTIAGTSEQTFTINNSEFTDADNDTISLSLITANGSDLPSWITYDVDSSGNLVVKATSPGNGSIDLIVLGSDGNGGDAQGTFTLTYSGGVNQSPQVATDDGIYYMDGTLKLNANGKLDSFSITQGDFATITSDYLDERDSDDDGADLTYTITTATTNGQLEIWEDTNKNGKADTLVRVLEVNDTFTAQDLKDGLIQYKHTGSDISNDSFVFNLTDNDGATVSGVTFNITVNEAPLSPQLNEIVRYRNTDITNSDTVSFKLKFSEAVFGLSTDDLNITGTLANTNVSISDITVGNAGEYIVTLSGSDIVDANGTLGLELKSNATIFSGSTRTTIDSTIAPTRSETFTLDNTAPTATFSRTNETQIIINFSEVLSNELTQSEISVSDATIAGFEKISDKSYKVTLSNISTTTEPIITVNADSVQDNAQNYNAQATYTVKGAIDVNSDDDWIPILNGDKFDPNDDTQAKSDGVDLVGNNDNTLLYTQYNGSELAFRVRMESNTDSGGTFYLVGIDGTNDGSIDFFMGVFLSSNGRIQEVKFYEAGDGANDSPSTTSFNVKTAVSPSNSLIDVKGTGSDLDSNGKEDGFVSFKFDVNDFVNFANGLGGLTSYTIDSSLSFILVTATQTNSINGDIGGRDGKSNEPWADLLTPIVFNNIAPTSLDTTVTFNESSSYVLKESDFSFSDSDGDSLASVIITTLPTKGEFLYNNGGIWEYVTLNQEISISDITNGNLKYTPVDGENGISYDSFNFKVSDGKSSSIKNYSVTFDVNSVNSIPVISNFDGDVQYWSNSNESVALDPFTYSVISDADGVDFNSGILTISVSGGTITDNQLSVVDNGNITISGNEISYDGTVIGTIDDTNDGVNGRNLEITFNRQSTQEKITELITALRFTYTGEEFISPIRTISMNITDGDGASSNTATLTMVGPPVYNNSGYEDTPLTFDKADYNIESTDTIKITKLNSNNGTWTYSGGTVLSLGDTLNATEFNSLIYTPNMDIYGNGIDSLSYKYQGTINSTGFDSNGDSYIQPTIIIGLEPINDAVVIDLNGQNDGTTTSTTYIEYDGTDFSSNDVYLTNGYAKISDVDGSTLESLNISVNSYANDELIIGNTTLDLRQNTTGSVTVDGVNFTYTVNFSSTSSNISFETASASDSTNYENLLNSIKFNNSSDVLDTTPRVFNISANDGTTQSTSVSSTVNVTAVNDTPIMNDVKLNNQYDVELDTAIVLAPSVILDDLDGKITSVTVTINSIISGDSLNFTNTTNVSGIFDAGTGILTLTNTGSTADMQDALRTITFSSTSDVHSTLRYIDFVATDNDSASTNIASTKVDLVDKTPFIDLDSGSDTGSPTTDDITSDDTPTFTITLPTITTADSTLELFDIDGNVLGTITVQPGQSTASITVSTLPQGLQTIFAKVTDAGTDRNKDSNEAELEIYVDSINPTLESGQVIDYVENSVTSDILGKVEASDVNGIDSFAILSGNTAGYFSIDNNGNITLTSIGQGTLDGYGHSSVESNDYQTNNNSFTLGIQVTDAVGNISTQDVTLNVTNVDESAPTFNTTIYNYTENQVGNAVIATLDASDDIGITSYTLNSVAENGGSSTDYSSNNYFTIDNNGNIAITLAGVQALTNDFETTPNSFALSIDASDLAGNTTTQTITLNVTNINDAPILDPIVEGYVTDTSGEISTQTNLSGILNAIDSDGDTITYSIYGEELSSKSTYDKKVIGTYGTLYLNSTTGAYIYEVDEVKINVLSSSDNLTENFNLSVSDGSLSDTKTFNINLKGANDAPTLDIVDNVVIIENPIDPGTDDTQNISLSGNALFDDIDNTSDTVSVTSAYNNDIIWSAGTIDSTLATNLKDAFSLTSVTDGSSPGTTPWTYDISGVDLTFLGENETISFSYDVTATDSNTESVTKTITFIIKGQSSTPQITSENTEGNVVEDGVISGTSSDTGTLKAIDSDVNTIFTWSGDASGTYGSFVIDSSTGVWTYTLNDTLSATQALQSGDNVSETFTVAVTDGTTPVTKDVIIRIAGTNDAPLLSSVSSMSYIDSSANDTFVTKTGILSSSDVDANDTKVYSIVSQVSDFTLLAYDNSISGNYGKLYFNSSSGVYKYVPDDAKIEAAISADTDTFSFVVTDSKGSIDTKDLVINISGTNDTPSIIANDNSVDINETNSVLSAIGDFTVTDIDKTQELIASVLNTSTIQLNSDNAITMDVTQLSWLSFVNATVLDNTETTDSLIWKFNSGSEFFNDLSVGDTLTLTYNIQVDDGTISVPQTVTVVINGTNDAPSLSILNGDKSTGDITENNSANRTVSGTVTLGEKELRDTLSANISSVKVNSSSTAPNVVIPTNAEILAMLSLDKSTFLSDDSTQSEKLTWSFDSGNFDFNGLAKGETLIFDYNLQVNDGTDTLNDTIKITITGTDDVRALIPVDVVGVIESGTTVTDSGSITFTDVDISNRVSLSESLKTISGTKKDSSVLGITSAQQTAIENAFSIINTSGNTNDGTIAWDFTISQGDIDFLASGESIEAVFTIEVTNLSGQIDTQDVTITLAGQNKAPVISNGPGISNLVETDTLLSDTIDLTASDVNVTDSVVAEVLSGTVQRTGGSAESMSSTQLSWLRLADYNILDNTESTNNMPWEFNSGTYTFDDLSSDETLTLVYTVKITDDAAENIRKSDTETITITIQGTNDAPNILEDAYVSLIEETNSSLIKTGEFTIQDLDTLNEVTLSKSLSVSGTSNRADSSAPSDADLENMFILPSIAIIDNSSTKTVFNWEFNSINETFDYLHEGDTLILEYTITARDNDTSNPASDSQTITLTIVGTNDAPKITINDVNYEELLDASNTNISKSGIINISDKDTADIVDVSFISNSDILWSGGDIDIALSRTLMDGFSIVESTTTNLTTPSQLNWLYNPSTLNLDFLGKDETITFSYKVTAIDASDEVTDSNINITITGTNDTPDIQIVDVNGTILEGTTLSDNGSITFTDVDLTDRAMATQSTKSVTALAQNGTSTLVLSASQQADIEEAFSIVNVSSNTNDGIVTWDYTISEDKLDFLGSGETVTAVFTIRVTDDEGAIDTQDITITITGSNDTPTVNTSKLYVEIGFGAKLEAQNLKDYFGFADKDLTDTFKFELLNAPTGIVIDANTGIISGQPSQSGEFVITIRGIDDEGAVVNKTFDMLVIAPPQPDSSTDANISSNNEIAQEIVKEITVDRIDSMISSFSDIADNTNQDTQNSDDGLAGLLNGQNGDNGNSNNNDGLEIAKTELTTLTKNTDNNPSGRLISASLSLDVDNTGKVNVSDKSSKAFSTVGLSIEKMDFVNEQIEIKILDTRVGQKYIVTLSDGSDLPPSLSFDPNTGIVKGILPVGMEELALSIKALSIDGTTRVLNIKIDINQLKEKTKDIVKESKFETLSEQIKVQNDNMNSYGKEIASLFNNFAS